MSCRPTRPAPLRAEGPLLETELERKGGGPVVVAPIAHFKRQWAAAASSLGLHVDPAWCLTGGNRARPRPATAEVTVATRSATP